MGDGTRLSATAFLLDLPVIIDGEGHFDALSWSRTSQRLINFISPIHSCRTAFGFVTGSFPVADIGYAGDRNIVTLPYNRNQGNALIIVEAKRAYLFWILALE
ncbi:hypothetical protein [Rhizobium sp. RM]|uniref:hypothetical protein n=1 Tax=Rhizobium sp. RM TaxID=2748079 RepID=UPI00110E7F3C|nr:hypothetical protein [Rhizobium sp. RM]NWJ25407.1 hypothetical protein [Rhizobium sp. RM]TMV22040.1 hypothetical protein BJG94_03455 [Rhizobium sp. Td3]